MAPQKGQNAEIILTLRDAWRNAQRTRGINAIRIRHVRSHIGDPGNELADALATIGCLADPQRGGTALGWQDAHQKMHALTPTIQDLVDGDGADRRRSQPRGDG